MKETVVGTEAELKGNKTERWMGCLWAENVKYDFLTFLMPVGFFFSFLRYERLLTT